MSERENNTLPTNPAAIEVAKDACAAASDGSDSLHGKIIQFDEGQLLAHLDAKVTQSVEETLNALLDAEADALCKAGRYERSAGRATRVRGTTSASCTPRLAK